MNAPEWNALLIAVGVGVAFWAAIELLLRWSAARRVGASRDNIVRADGERPDRHE